MGDPTSVESLEMIQTGNDPDATSASMPGNGRARATAAEIASWGEMMCSRNTTLPRPERDSGSGGATYSSIDLHPTDTSSDFFMPATIDPRESECKLYVKRSRNRTFRGAPHRRDLDIADAILYAVSRERR
jgi:hypothetical protein